MIHLLEIIGWPIILPLVAVVISTVLLYNSIKCFHRIENSRVKLLQITASLMLLIWSIGWGLYMAAISLGANAQTGTLEKIFRSAVSAIGLFAFNIDSNIFDGINHCTKIKDGISVMAFMAGLCTILLIVLVIFRRFYASSKLWLVSKMSCFKRSKVYFFWGWNQQSKLLAESIRSHHGEDEDYWIVIAEPSISTGLDEQSNTQISITKLLTHKKNTLLELNQKNTLVALANADLSIFKTEEKSQSSTTSTDVLCKIGLGSVVRLITSGDVESHLFFLSDKENYNVSCVRSLSNDSINFEGNVKYYCRARRNDLFKTIEDLATKKDMVVEMIDTSHMSIEALKRDVNHHPINLVNIDKDNPTTVKDDLVSLIIGFDSTGRDALRFMYEFGCFVDSASTDARAFRSPFHCTVVDKELRVKSAAFKIMAPLAVSAQNSDGTPLISFKEYDYNSEEFYSQIIKPIANKVNAIFIAVGNHQEEAALSIRLFKYIRQRRSDLSKLRIYVRCYSSEQEDIIQQVASHYNEGAGLSTSVIIPFGKESDLFSYPQIVGTDFRDEGKIYQEAYSKLRGEHELWDLRHGLLTGKVKYIRDDKGNKIKDAKGGYLHSTVPKEERVISLDDLSSLRRKERQDESNALHALTKMYLFHQCLPDLDEKDFLSRYFIHDESGTPSIPKREGFGTAIRYTDLLDNENAVIHNLAVLEHLRWNASHELLGYTRSNANQHSCDERTMQHNCLCDWQELDAESNEAKKANGWDADYISFDFSVVDTFIKMNLNK